MSVFILVPGAGGSGWFWHRVAAELERAGHTPIAIELPGADPSAGLPEYAEIVLRAADGRDDVVLVAQSMGAFTALAVCADVAPRRLALLNAMIPSPGETAGDWWENTGSQAARRAAARAGGYAEEFDLETYFLHDLPPDLRAEMTRHGGDEADIAFEQPCPFTDWPDVPTSVLAGRDDRFFPFAFQRRVARERLGIEARELPGGHLNALSEPGAVAAALLAPEP